MSRFRRVAHSVASGYALLGFTALYALVSLPLALHYLSTERFGLWGLMSSIAGYLSLIDLGMSGSLARLLIDHKDDPERGTYGSLIKTGWLVLVTQGLIIFVAGFSLAPMLSRMLAIQADLQGEFIQLARWQSLALAVSFMVRIFSHLLQAHQRIDLTNYVQISTLGLNFVLLWWFFQSGEGVFSLAWATLLSSLAGGVFGLVACWQMKLFPPLGAWGRASWSLFQEIFNYGKDMFLIAVGTQLILASQTMIITRRLGLGQAGAWYAGTRAFNLVSQAVWRLFDVSTPALSEMIVRRERALLRERYEGLIILTASVSAFAAVAFALCNSLFITVYTGLTKHPIEWQPGNDVLLGIWMVVMAILHCHNCFVLITKDIGFMRYVYFIEGSVFVLAALLTAKWGGLPAIISCSVICSLTFSGAYGVWRICRYFDLPAREVVWEWLAPMRRVLALLVPSGLAAWWLFKPLDQPWLRLGLHVLLSSSLGFYLLLRFGLSRAFQKELLERSPKSLNLVLRRVFVGLVP